MTTYNIKDNEGTYTIITDKTERPETTVMEGDSEITMNNYIASCAGQKVAIQFKPIEPSEEVDQMELSISKEGDVIKATGISRLNGKITDFTTTYCVPRMDSENL